MITIYGATFVSAVVLAVICRLKYADNEKELTWLFSSLAVVNFGYTVLSVSRTLSLALVGNSIAYLGSVMLPVFAYIVISKLCNFNIPKWLMTSIILLGVIVLIITTSPFYSTVYYKTVELSTLGSATVLKKTYGILHPMYKVYVLAYLLLIVFTIIKSCAKKMIKSARVSLFLTFIVGFNVAVWLIENIVGAEFEALSVSYAVTEVIILMLYDIVNELSNQVVYIQVPEVKLEDVPLTNREIDFCMSNVDDVELSDREKEVARLLLLGIKRKDIANTLGITESTVKKHSSNIYKKFQVTNRKEFKDKIKNFGEIT